MLTENILVEVVRMNADYRTLGNYIQLVDERNRDFSVTNLLGVSIGKKFIPSIANIVGTDLSNYKIVRTGQFAYGPVTSRNGEKISIAYLDGEDCIISSSYTVFEVENKKELDSEYLMLWFSRPEFDRYARYKSHGSVREIFDWNELCMVELPIPDIEKQKNIVKEYKTVTERIVLKQRINDNLLSQAQTYFRLIFADKDAEKPLPQGWKVAKIGDYCIDNIANLSKTDTFESILYLDTSSITSNYIIELQELNLLTDEIPSRAKRKATHGDIVYSTVRPNLKHYGLLQNPPENLIVSTGFAVLHNKGLGVTNDFLFMWLIDESILDYLQAIAENSVSTYPSLNVSDLMNITIIVPDANVLEKTTRFLASIFTAISENNRQIQMLTRSLDTLLPKLLSRR